jgi:cell wall-associated NlpC family hydrolase
MRRFNLPALFLLLVFSVFTTGCDVAKIMDVVTKVAEGISKAAPAIQDAVKTISEALPTNTNNTTNADDTAAANNGEQPANNANVTITNPGDQEEVSANTTNAAATNAAAARTGSTAVQSRIASSIKGLLNSKSFRGADVDGGNLACAKVVSTALKNAGVLSRVSINCDAVVNDLKAVGWRRVNVPPYQEGDVVTWTTSRGPGRHIGIIVKQGSTFQAISNSSELRTPRVHAINYMPVTQVLRKV